MTKIIPIKELRASLKNTALISKMCSETNEPIYIT